MNKQDNVPQVKSVYDIIMDNVSSSRYDEATGRHYVEFTFDDCIKCIARYASPFKDRMAELEAERDKYREALEEITKTDCPMNQVMCGMIDCNCKVVGKSNDANYKKALKNIASLKYSSTIHPTVQGKAAIAIAEQALNSKEENTNNQKQ